MTRESLPSIVEAALRALGGAAPVVSVAKWIWEHHESDLRSAGNLFYTWQYEMRWAAQKLRDAGKLTYSKVGARKVWALIGSPG